MGYGRLKWCLLLALVTTNSAIQCPENGSCICGQGHTGDYQMECPVDENSAFIVNILPNKYVQVQCRNSPKWSDFHVQSIAQARDVGTVIFRMCSLPNSSLHEITQKMGVSETKNLVFESYGNLGSSFERYHLSGFPGLNNLSLSSNGLTDLPIDLFEDLPELTRLNLRENYVRLPSQILKSVPKLRFLELGNNVIERIDAHLFSYLPRLEFLNLWSIQLRELVPHTFDGLISLEALDITRNKLTTLPEGIFAPLQNLKVLNMNRNNFSSLPENLLSHNVNLTALKLFENGQNLTTLPRGFLSNLTKLTIAKLMSNGLQYLPEDILWGTFNLRNLSLELNYLSELPKNIFKDLKELRSLNLAYNKLTTLPDGIFDSLNKLDKLNLAKNHLTTISASLFVGLGDLTELNMENNKLFNIHDQAFGFLTNLRVAQFSHNHLTFNDNSSIIPLGYQNQSPFSFCQNLKKLYLAHNKISEIFQDWTISAPNLRYLDLSYNQLSTIQDLDLQFTSQDIKVDLTNNNITHIGLKNIESFASQQDYGDSSREVHILVDHNPIDCDCDVYDLLTYLEGKMHPNTQKFFHLIPGSLKCGSPSSLQGLAIPDIKSESFTCLAGNDLCPNNCTCWRRPGDQAFLINCSYRNMSKAPEKLTVSAGYHIELNLTGNFLTEMPSINQSGYGYISKMLLSHNYISSVSPDGISPNLKELTLHNNDLSEINSTVLDFMKNRKSLKKLTLHANPWKCNCEAREFLNFIQTKYTDFPELINITCHGSNKFLSNMTVSDLCPLATGMIVGISLMVAVLGLAAGTLAALYYRYQQEIKVWLYAHHMCLWFVTEEELDKDKMYDAFISYSHKDEDFVLEELVTKLEAGPMPFKLCLHFRNWLAGEWIPKQIARSVDNSKRTIVVLSPNFVESVWGRLEFRAAHRQALSEGRARVIVVLFGDIGPTDNLDPELKVYLSMNTYVKWGDPWFWDKLRYALPHRPELTKRTAKKQIFKNHQPSIQLNGDKNGLTHPLGVPVTIPSITTPPANSIKTFIPNADVRNGSVLIDTLQNDKPETNVTIAKHNDTPTKNNYKNNIINVQCTPV